MAITVAERDHGIKIASGDQQSLDIPYVIRGATSYQAAYQAFIAAIPLERDNMDLLTADVDEEEAENLFSGTAHYEPYTQKPLPQPKTGETLFGFSTGGETTKIYQAYKSWYYSAPGAGPAPDFQGAINVSGKSDDLKVDGVDVPTPSLKFNLTYYAPRNFVTWTYAKTLATLTGRVNLSRFKSFDAGEVLFLGCDGSLRNEKDWELNFNFNASSNAINLRVGEILVGQKRGWDYLWAYYRPEEDAKAKCVIPKAQWAWVCEVHQYANFNFLGIGT